MRAARTTYDMTLNAPPHQITRQHAASRREDIINVALIRDESTENVYIYHAVIAPCSSRQRQHTIFTHVVQRDGRYDKTNAARAHKPKPTKTNNEIVRTTPPANNQRTQRPYIDIEDDETATSNGDIGSYSLRSPTNMDSWLWFVLFVLFFFVRLHARWGRRRAQRAPWWRRWWWWCVRACRRPPSSFFSSARLPRARVRVRWGSGGGMRAWWVVGKARHTSGTLAGKPAKFWNFSGIL